MKESNPQPMKWQLRNQTLEFGETPLLMGIVNVTPDSFSDGGNYFEPEQAVEHALQLEQDGAAILDIGGESTRPGAQPVSVEEELSRVLPVIKELVEKSNLPISIDTSKASVAQVAIDHGAQIVNDVTALEGDPEMLAVAQRSGVGLCLMHMQGTPRTMQQNPEYGNVLEEVKTYLTNRTTQLAEQGIEKASICIDPGIGFGKTTEHNLELIRRVDELQAIGCPVLVGHSRKRFLGELLGDMQADRTAATVGVSLALANRGVQLLRLHDVRPVRDALITFRAC